MIVTHNYENFVSVIGGGLAGTEAAYQIAKRGIPVKLFEMRPYRTTQAHTTGNLAEIVCSNSLKSKLHTNACGLLKEELNILDSLLIKIAEETEVPAGQALAVDREKFSKRVTEEIEKNPLIEIIREEVMDPANEKNCLRKMVHKGVVVIATGPLTSRSMSLAIEKLIGREFMHFYDASAPIVEKDSINFDIAFYGDRYEQERKKDESVEDWKERISKIEKGSYINLPMNKEEYEHFCKELINAELAEIHYFDRREFFEGCMPIETMANRGIDTLRFGPLKPVGFTDPRTGKRPYAVVQLRQDDSLAKLYNIVGFQTNLKFGEQRRVFGLIPGLEKAEFVRYGVMHRNTFINSTNLLDETYNLKSNHNVYFAGQVTGVEGYVESIASGLLAGINSAKRFKQMQEYLENKGKSTSEDIENMQKIETDKIHLSEMTMIGALAKYISTPNKDFQPMNANFGILPPLDESIKDKKMRYTKLSDRAIAELKKNCDKINTIL